MKNSNISFERYFLFNEISEENIKKIASDIQPDKLPFGDIFGDKYRIEEEFIAVSNDMEYIIEHLKDEYEVNLDSKTIKSKNSNNPQKLSKFIKRESDKVIDKIQEENDKYNVDLRNIFKLRLRHSENLINDPDLDQLLNAIYKKFNDNIIRFMADNDSESSDYVYEMYKDKFKDLSLSKIKQKFGEVYWSHIENWTKQWAISNYTKIEDIILRNKSTLFQHIYDTMLNKYEKSIISSANNIENLIPYYHIIYSRHPIDILRMSDYQGIQSCHSEGGGYFECAVQEASEGGLIAYLVNSKQFKLIDNLQKKEIFSDTERNVSGIQPDGRLRIRLYKNSDNQAVLIPEDTTYGKHTRDTIGDEFGKSVLEWSKGVQNLGAIFNHKDSINLDDWRLVGGYYEDTPSDVLFKKMFPENEFEGEVKKYSVESDMNMLEIWRNEWQYFLRDIGYSKPETKKWIEFDYEWVDVDGNHGLKVFDIVIKIPLEVSSDDEDQLLSLINDGIYIMDILSKTIDHNIVFQYFRGGKSVLQDDPYFYDKSQNNLEIYLDFSKNWEYGLDGVRDAMRYLYDLQNNFQSNKLSDILLDELQMSDENTPETRMETERLKRSAKNLAYLNNLNQIH